MIGSKIIRYDEVESTSKSIANMLENGLAQHGMVIMAENQTAGRGQRGAIWQSEKGKNILFSVYLQTPGLLIEHAEALSHFVSLAICDCLHEMDVPTKIKWPNDILIDSLKIAGILIENQLQGSRILGSIIGIGINYEKTQNIPQGSTYFQANTSSTISKTVFSEKLIERLNLRYEQLLRHDYTTLKKDFLDNLWLLNEPSKFQKNETIFEGIIRGTDENGKLLIEQEGELKSYDLKELKFIARNV